MLYTSRYPELGFYVNGGRRQFRGGFYRTSDTAEISVLDRLSDVKAVEEPEVVAQVSEPIPEVTAEPANRAKAGRKPAKASAK